MVRLHLPMLRREKLREGLSPKFYEGRDKLKDCKTLYCK